jgi:hypothetical protein
MDTLDPTILDPDADEATLGVGEADHGVRERPCSDPWALAIQPLAFRASTKPFDLFNVRQQSKLLQGKRVAAGHSATISLL